MFFMVTTLCVVSVHSQENNSNCYFSFRTGDFISEQQYDGFVVYEIPNMNSSELKSAVYTAISSIYKSPKDVPSGKLLVTLLFLQRICSIVVGFISIIAKVQHFPDACK